MLTNQLKGISKNYYLWESIPSGEVIRDTLNGKIQIDVKDGTKFQTICESGI